MRYEERRPTVQLLKLLIGLSLLAFSTLAEGEKSIHTVFTTECSSYFNWQALAIYHSYQKSGQKGPITRLLSCTADQLKIFKDVEGIPTHIAPSWSIHPRTGDAYSGINKPVAVRDWLEKAQPTEEFIFIIDSDTIMREGFNVEEVGLRPGWAISGYYGYLKGVNNELATKHIPEVPPRNDTLAGPRYRKSDQVGGFTFMSKSDLQRMVDNWVSITEDVRADPDAWTLSGDVFTKQPGDKPWIAEMYGYSYAAAKADVWHHTSDRVMQYPGYLPLGLHEPPKVLHYGIEYRIEEPPFAFDKHWYLTFEPQQCPPWTSFNEAGRPTGGLFPNPPHPSQLKTQGLELLRDLLAIQTMATLNEALCLRHMKACPPSQELDSKCHEVLELAVAVTEAIKAVITAPSVTKCGDNHPDCPRWANANECDKNPRFMQTHCRLSCKVCDDQPDKEAPADKPPGKEVPGNTQGISEELLTAQEDAEEDVPDAAQAVKQPASVTELLRACHINTRLSMAQVKDCMLLAKKGKPYLAPTVNQPVVVGRQARPNLAHEELRKTSPDGEKSSSANSLRSRKLREGARSESRLWDGEHKAVAFIGVGVLVLVVVVKVFGVLSRKGRPQAFGKGLRRD